MLINDLYTNKTPAVTEANDPNFVGFMNNTLGDRVDAKPEQPKTGHDWYDNAPTMSMDNMPSYKHAFKFGMSVLQSMDAETKQHFAEADNDELFSYLMKLARKKRFEPKYFVEEDMFEVTGLFSEIFHDPSMVEWEWSDLLRSTLNNQDMTESMGGQVVFRGTGDDGGTYEIIQSGDGFMIHANGKHIDTYGSLQRSMSVLKNEVPGLTKGVAEGLSQTLRKVVPGYARREIDRKMDAEKFGRTDVDRDANYYRYKKIQDKLKEQGVAEAQTDYQKRRQRERDVDAGKPVKPEPKNPQNDYFARRKKEKDLAEDDDAVAAFMARGGEIQRLKPAKPRKGERWQGSAHIGAAGGRGTKGRVSGLAANTGKSGKPVVTAEDSAPTLRSIVNPRSKSGVVSKADLEDYRLKSGNPTATLGQYMNQQQGKTFRKGGANDPDVIAATQNKAVATTAEPKPGSWQELAKLNNITDPTKLQTGTYIKTPDGGSVKVNKGDTLSDIAQYMSVSGTGPQYREPGSDNKTSVQPTVSNPAPAPAAKTTDTQSSQQNKGQNVGTPSELKKPPPLTDKDVASKKSPMSGLRPDLKPDLEKSEKAQPASTSSNSNARIQADIAALEREISRQKPSLDPKEQTRLGILNKELTDRQAAAAAAEAPAAVSAKAPVVPTYKYDPARDLEILNKIQPYYNRRNSGMPSVQRGWKPSMAQNESISQRLTKEFDHMLEHLLSEATNQHKIPDFSVPIIPDNMPFGRKFGGGGGGGSAGNAMHLSAAGRLAPAPATKSQAMATQRNVGGKEIPRFLPKDEKAMNSKVNTTSASSNLDLPVNVQIAPSMRPAPTDKNFSDFLKGQSSQTFGPATNTINPTNKPTKVDIQDAGDFYPESKNITNRGITNTSEASLGDYSKKAPVSRAGAEIKKFLGRDDPAAVAAADRTIANRTKGLARADARRRPYTAPPVAQDKQRRDLADKYPNIDELVRRAELNRDPQYDRADGQAYYDGRDAEQNYHKLKQIQRMIRGAELNEMDLGGVSQTTDSDTGDEAAYNKYAGARATGDMLNKEMQPEKGVKSFISPQARAVTQDLTTGLAGNNPELEKRYTMNKLTAPPPPSADDMDLEEDDQVTVDVPGSSFTADKRTNTLSGTTNVHGVNMNATKDMTPGGATTFSANTNVAPNLNIAATQKSADYNKGQLAGTKSVAAKYTDTTGALGKPGQQHTATRTAGVGFGGATGANVGKNYVDQYSVNESVDRLRHLAGINQSRV